MIDSGLVTDISWRGCLEPAPLAYSNSVIRFSNLNRYKHITTRGGHLMNGDLKCPGCV